MVVDLESILQHHGVKGMKWGVRKDRDTKPRYKVYGDGRIEIPAGEKMQRLVTSKQGDKASRSLTGYAYASFLPSDNAQYIYKMAPNTTAKGSDLKRDTILTLKTKHELKSPSLDEAQQITVDVMKKHADEMVAYSKARKENKNYSLSKETDSWWYMMTQESSELDNYNKTKAMEKEFDTLARMDYVKRESELIYHPEKYPAYMYAIANHHIANDDPSITPFKKQLLGAVESKGYNMIRDETDVRSGKWTAPVIVLKPEENIGIELSKKISGRTIRQSQKHIEKGKQEFDSLIKKQSVA